MLGLFASVFGLALVDSINPSAFAVTIYLLLSVRRPTSSVLTYISGIFAAYFSVGLALILGLDALTTRFDSLFSGSSAYVLSGIVGGVLLYISFFPPGGRKVRDRTPRSLNHTTIFGLGLGISLVEFSTAFPYIGAIGMIGSSSLPMSQWLPVLVAYNLIMIVPPVLMLAAHRLFGERIQPRLERARHKILEGGRETTLWITGIVGFILLANFLNHFEFFGLIELANTGGQQ
ncbi:GAP family protein [Actinomadura spongiicola]|uniref:GAP family protein n=1 Tax=Actinomadura spongiicola TaxID=2303421 RepID=UPI0013144064|nr:GAP family protein [Actinomadura spongiicola]